MKILVIGSEGFIGKNIINFYKERNCEVFGIDNKISLNKNAYTYFHVLSFNYTLESILGKTVPDVCIFAGGSANVQLSVTQPTLDFESNVSTVSKILESLVKINNSCKFLHLSSAAVYGNPKKLPVKETSALEPLSPYGWHKYQAETLCREYFNTYQLPTCSVRPFSVFGEGQTKLLFWDLFYKFKAGEDNIQLFGSGNETRDFIHINDFLHALDIIIRHGKFDSGSYNIGCGKETTIKKAAELFRDIVGSKKEIIFNKKPRNGDPNHWCADICRLEELGFKQTTSLETGLEMYHKWLKENA